MASLSEEDENTYRRLLSFLTRPAETGYTFACADDERLIPLLNRRLQSDAPGINLLVLAKADESDVPYLEQIAQAVGRNEGIVVTNLSEIVQRDSGYLQSLNFSRERLNALDKPILFWLTPNTLRRLTNQAADLFSQRRYGTFYFEDKLPDSSSSDSTSQRSNEPVSTVNSIDVLEEQLNVAQKLKRPVREIAQTIALPLAQAYAESGEGSRGLDLLTRYHDYLNRDDADTLFALGEVHRLAQDYDWAITYYGEAVKKLPEDRRKGVCYERLGFIYESLGNYQQAINYYESQLTLTEELIKQEPNEEWYQHDLSHSLDHLGYIHKSLNQLDIAKNFLEKNLAISQHLLKTHKNHIQYARNLAIAHEHLGEIYQLTGHVQAATYQYKQFYFLSKSFVDQYPTQIDYIHGFLIANERLGKLHELLGELKEAQKYYFERLKLSKQLINRQPNKLEFQRDLAISHSYLSKNYELLNDSIEALEYAQEYYKLSKGLYHNYKKLIEVRRGYAMAARKLGDLLLKNGQPEKALLHLNEARDLWEAIQSETDSSNTEPVLEGIAIEIQECESALSASIH